MDPHSALLHRQLGNPAGNRQQGLQGFWCRLSLWSISLSFYHWCCLGFSWVLDAPVKGKTIEIWQWFTCFIYIFIWYIHSYYFRPNFTSLPALPQEVSLSKVVRVPFVPRQGQRMNLPQQGTWRWQKGPGHPVAEKAGGIFLGETDWRMFYANTSSTKQLIAL